MGIIASAVGWVERIETHHDIMFELMGFSATSPSYRATVLAPIFQCAIITNMNSKHVKTLEAIFTDPISGALPWNCIEALLVAVGCNVIEGSGSSVTFEKNGRRAYFHRPHPQREALIYRVKAVRAFLIKLEIMP